MQSGQSSVQGTPDLKSRSSLGLVEHQPIVLAVDDDEDNLLLLVEVLKQFDCSLITANYGEKALLLAQAYQPDLILLDIMLPDFDGVEVVHRLKQNPNVSTIPVVAITALAREEDRDILLRAGCSGYISKPYMLDELETIISCYLQKVASPC